MPNQDGSGPQGQGSGKGKGAGQGRGRASGPGPGGFCVCPDCGEKVPHQQGKPCYGQKCPKCGKAMVRE